MSENMRSVDDLERPDHLASQRLEWKLERIGWISMAIILVAALLGFLGRGPLTRGVATSSNGSLTVQFYRVERYEAPAELRLYLNPEDHPAGIVRLALSRSFTNQITLESINPEPVSVEAEGERTIYTVRVSELNEQAIIYRFQYVDFGPMTLEVGLDGQEPISIHPFVLP